MGFSRQEYCSGLPCPPPGVPSQPRDRTGVSHFAGGFFTLCPARDAVCVYACILTWIYACAHVRAQLCLTLQSHGCGPPGSSVPGIFQARVLEWGAIAFSMPASPNRRTKRKYFLDVAIILIPFFARRGLLHSSRRNNFSEIFPRQYMWYVLEPDLSQMHRLQKA